MKPISVAFAPPAPLVTNFSASHVLAPRLAPRVIRTCQPARRVSHAAVAPRAQTTPQPPRDGVATDGNGTGSVVSSDLSAATAKLQAAATAVLTNSKRPSVSEVSSALSQTERLSRRQRLPINSDLLDGEWRLILTQAARARFPFPTALYFPVDARATFRGAPPTRFDNSVRFAGARLTLTGPARWAAASNLLAFTFCELEVSAGALRWGRGALDPDGDSLDGRPDSALPFFTFFFVDDHIIAARGRSGGLALWARMPGDAHAGRAV